MDTKWCCENINSGDIKFKNVISEVKELIEADNSLDRKEELGDVIYFWNCWLYCKFKINLPMFGAMGSIKKFIRRLSVWKMLFWTSGLEFHPKYLVNGSNYEKEEKILLAIELARKDQVK